MSPEELQQYAREQQLIGLRSRHETLGAAYREACEELTRLRKENETYRARLHAVPMAGEHPRPLRSAHAMIDIVSHLAGEIVEIYTYGGNAYDILQARGTVRAIYIVDKDLRILVEHNLGWDSLSYIERTKDGGFASYSLHEGKVRVVQRCDRCNTWDQKALLVQSGAGDAWEHKAGESCKKVGHGG